MVGLINRSEYGNLSCAWAVFQARFTRSCSLSRSGDIIKLKELKHYKDRLNPVDCCDGSLPLPTHLKASLNRDYYCPYLKTRTDERACQWVHSGEPGGDPQKSKPVGQAAIVLVLLGLADPTYATNGNLKELTWTKYAKKLHKLSWGDPIVEQWIRHRLNGFGPLISLAHHLNSWASDHIQSSDLQDKFVVLHTGEGVNVECCGNTRTLVDWDGGSRDASIRTTAALFSLAASAGLIEPTGYIGERPIGPKNYAGWLNERAKNGTTTMPRSWMIQRGALTTMLRDAVVTLGIGSKHFVPKSTARGALDKCANCGKNFINLARNQHRKTLTFRRLLLIRALMLARQKGLRVDTVKLAALTDSLPEFHISPGDQARVLTTIEPKNIHLFGAVTEADGSILELQVDLAANAFGEIDPAFTATMDTICAQPGVLVV
jgi:hypothetical protein